MGTTPSISSRIILDAARYGPVAGVEDAVVRQLISPAWHDKQSTARPAWRKGTMAQIDKHGRPLIVTVPGVVKAGTMVRSRGTGVDGIKHPAGSVDIGGY